MTNDNKQPGYILKKHIVKFLTFWIFPEILRKYAARRLRWRLGIGAQPETLAERLNYQRHIKQARKEAATKTSSPIGLFLSAATVSAVRFRPCGVSNRVKDKENRAARLTSAPIF